MVASPVEHTRIRMQVQKGPKESWAYGGTFDCYKKIIQTHGMKGIYKGLSVTILRDLGYCFWFGPYEVSKRLLNVD